MVVTLAKESVTLRRMFVALAKESVTLRRMSVALVKESIYLHLRCVYLIKESFALAPPAINPPLPYQVNALLMKVSPKSSLAGKTPPKSF